MTETATPIQTSTPPMIPRDILFGNPSRAQARIAPDGKRLSYLAPLDGVLNIWVKTIGTDDDRAITHDSDRGIQLHYWAEDNQHILYRQDKDGDENWHVYAIDIESGTSRDLTPFEGIQATPVALAPSYPDQLLIQMNQRNPQLMDLFRVSLATGEHELVAENPGNVVGWIADHQLQARAAVAALKDGGYEILVRDSEADTFRRLISWGPDDSGHSYGFTPDGAGLYVGDSRGTDLIQLKTINLATGREEILATDPRVDLGDVLIHPTKHHAQAASFTYDRDRWVVLDDEIADDFATIAAHVDATFAIVARDRRDQTWLVAYDGDQHPTSYYSYRRDTKEMEFLFSMRPELEDYVLAGTQFVEIKARDGLTLPCYLTIPPGAEPKNLPMVLNVHGGPWHRDTWEYRGDLQWFANRGWAVLQVNFRGSTGFGKAFLNAGNREWGRKMQHDLTDAVQWAIAEGIADPQRVAIFGGSYGGYAALAGAAFTPDLYCCSVDLIGPSNLLTFLETIPPYWETMRQMLHHRLGDPEKDEAMLKERSPLFSIDQISIPLLIGQGANDPRVKAAESEQIVQALEAKGHDIEYALYPDEGHGFARPENRLDFFMRSEQFLHKYLGGRIET